MCTCDVIVPHSFSPFLSYTHTPIGDNSCTMNVHLLRHLVTCVRNWGPLWVYSCFSFESMNGHLKALFHGSRDMSKQVGLIIRSHFNALLLFFIQLAFTYVMMQTLPIVIYTRKPQDGRVEQMLKALSEKKR